MVPSETFAIAEADAFPDAQLTMAKHWQLEDFR